MSNFVQFTCVSVYERTKSHIHTLRQSHSCIYTNTFIQISMYAWEYMVMYFVRFSFINVLDIKFICHLMGKPKVQQNAHIVGPTEWERQRVAYVAGRQRIKHMWTWIRSETWNRIPKCHRKKLGRTKKLPRNSFLFFSINSSS